MTFATVFDSIIRGELVVVLLGACCCMGAYLGRKH